MENQQTFHDKIKANYEGFSLVSGGLVYSLTLWLRGKSSFRKGMFRIAAALSFITWILMCILAIINGTLTDDTTTISFFDDFLFHIRK